MRSVTYKFAVGQCHLCKAMGPFYVMTLRKATNSVGKACWPDSAGMCETLQARVCPNLLCDFCIYFRAKMRVFVFVTYSSLKHVDPSGQLAPKDTNACDIATTHTARPCVLHMFYTSGTNAFATKPGDQHMGSFYFPPLSMSPMLGNKNVNFSMACVCVVDVVLQRTWCK